MSDAPHPPDESPTPRKGEFEDPHYHDDDDDLPADEETGHRGRPVGPRTPARRIPPPRRRHYED